MKLLMVLCIIAASIGLGMLFEKKYAARSGYLLILLMIAGFLFLFAGLPLLIFEENTDNLSDRVLVEMSLLNQSSTGLFLLGAGRGQEGTFRNKYFGYAILVGISALLFSTLWMSALERLGMVPDTQSLVTLLATSNSVMLAMVLTLIGLLAPLTEELLFRDTLQQVLKKELQVPGAILLTGTLFGLMHFDSWAAIFPLMLFGMALGWLRERTKSVLYSIIAHFINNMAIVLALLFF